MESPSDNGPILNVQQVTQCYGAGEHRLTVLDAVSFSLQRGDVVAIVGPSGSGKTTLLGLCAGLDKAVQGSISLAGHQLEALGEDERAAVRNAHVGFVFQNFQLLPTLTALENVMVPLELRGQSRGVEKRARELLDAVGLKERAEHYPVQLSGGEQQRVGLARAFANRPEILFADEPTGNLDGDTSERIAEMIFALNREQGTTLVLVTHDTTLAARCDRMLRIERGRLQEVAPVASRMREGF